MKEITLTTKLDIYMYYPMFICFNPLNLLYRGKEKIHSEIELIIYFMYD